MPTKKRTVTIQDVAKTAGVSVSTVSRVLNAKVDVASDTQERVLAVIDELGLHIKFGSTKHAQPQERTCLGL